MLTQANINHQTPYAEIKKWYEENMDKLPETLDGLCKYYKDVKFTAKLHMQNIASEAEKWGPEIKKSKIAKAAKYNLIDLWKDLQDPEAWNLGLTHTYEEELERRRARQKFHKR